MRTLDYAEHLSKQLESKYQKEAIVMLSEAQLDGLEKILESAPGLVDSVLNYNQCVALINQLRSNIRAAYLGCVFQAPLMAEGGTVSLLEKVGPNNA